ncbi:hypothetical protein QBC47DRAFT_218883 [Echria macrotheca]|uniref:Nephrocystin 3-like N-terminal domain-containing protein n=1 Tax=Echria macrotheca TaxID=438768 RepID=A0AAJ0BEP7_9PEZI|nr:hypothetical protein QBC47DRAFT_218883 [Echria macrotheca]
MSSLSLHSHNARSSSSHHSVPSTHHPPEPLLSSPVISLTMELPLREDTPGDWEENSLVSVQENAPVKVRDLGITVVYRPEKPNIDIVILHGLKGNAYGTFSHCDEIASTNEQEPGTQSSPKKRKREVYWPRDLLPLSIPDARVLAYGYDADPLAFLSGGQSLMDFGWNFLVRLEAERRAETEDPERPIIFIAHSMGGLVTKEALRRSRLCQGLQSHLQSIFQSTRGVIFLGTPHYGANPRGLLDLLLKILGMTDKKGFNLAVIEALKPRSELARDLTRAFNEMALEHGWMIHSFQEDRKELRLILSKAVEDDSSRLDLPFNEIAEHMARSHTQMCKFSSQNDPEYEKLEAAVFRIAKYARSKIGVPPDSLERPKQALLDSLRFRKINARKSAIKRAHPQTCEWLLSNSDYVAWLDPEEITRHLGILILKGKPGTGKSTLMKFALHKAQESAIDGRIVLSFFFNAHGKDLEKSAVGMYRSLLHQLLEKLPATHPVYQLPSIKLSGGRHKWDWASLEIAFEAAVQCLEHETLLCFIDALDEGDEYEMRQIISSFQRLAQMNTPSRPVLRACFSSRHYPYVRWGNARQLVLDDLEEHRQDIAKYLDSELRIGEGVLAQRIYEEAQAKASGLFIWAVLTTRMLNEAYLRGQVGYLEQQIDGCPDLDALFSSMVQKSRNRAEVRLCLLWVHLANCPLSPAQLYVAIQAGIEPEFSAAYDMDRIAMPDIYRYITHASNGLVEITETPPSVQFIHQTVGDFLGRGGVWELMADFETDSSSDPVDVLISWNGTDANVENGRAIGLSYDLLKNCCVDYLDKVNNDSLRELVAKSYPEEVDQLRESVSKRLSFLEHAVQNVLFYADMAAEYGIKQEAFLQHFKETLPDWIIWQNVFQKETKKWYVNSTRLVYLLAERNCANLLLCVDEDPFAVGKERYVAPILAAMVTGSEEAVHSMVIMKARTIEEECLPYEDLVQYNRRWTDVAVPDDFEFPAHETLPSYLARHGDARLVVLSLVDYPPETRIGTQTALCWAAENRELGLVKFLLGRGASKLPPGCTPPIALAARNGDEDIVKLFLLGAPEERSVLAQAALPGAVEANRWDLVVMLLEDAKPNSEIEGIADPLLTAVARGKHGLVRLLLEYGADVNVRSTNDWTPLHLVGHRADTCRELLNQGADIEAVDNLGKTPLLWGAERGCLYTVRVLLEYGANIRARDEDGRTALSLASMAGNEDVVKTLLQQRNANVEDRDNEGNTPLSLAARYGNYEVAEILLDHGAQVSAADTYGRTPLWRAVDDGDEKVVRLLLERGACTEDEDGYGLTCLSQAVILGNEDVVRVLLEFGANVEAANVLRRKAIDFARHFRMVNLVKLLEEHAVSAGPDMGLRIEGSKSAPPEL